MLVVSWFICGLIYFLLYTYLFKKFTGCQCRIKNINTFFLLMILFSLAYVFIMAIDIGPYRPYFVNAILLLTLLIIYKNSFISSLVCVTIIFFLACFCEIFYDLIIIFIFNYDLHIITRNPGIYVISNIIIFLLELIITRIKIIKDFFSNIVFWSDKYQTKIIPLLIFLAVSVLVFLTYHNFVKMLPSSILFLTNLFCIGVIVFIVGYFKEKASNNRITTEYDQLLDYVKRYERVIEAKSKNQHEYKNQLVMIKGLVSKNNTKAIKYIESLYNEETDDKNVDLLKKLKYLPKGGLKGLIYYKIDEMEDKKINYFVEISPEVKNVTFNKKIDKNLKDISKILGVYIDNAIEASFNSKEKYLILEVYIDNNDLMFSISNTYSGVIDLNKIDKEGYSTKGNGKGYGLSLVKDLINQNKYLEQERSMNGIYYTQKLRIKK